MITNGRYNHKQIVETFRDLYPDRAENLPTEYPDNIDQTNGFPKGGVFEADNSASREVLGLQYGTLKQAIQALIESIKDLEA